jgi:hypothetical protein
MTLVGADALSTRPGNAMMRLREGTGGKFGNLILANVATHPGIRIDTCSSGGSAAPSIVSVLPASSVSLDTYLFFSSNNIIEGPTAGFTIESPCTGTAPAFVNANPLISGGSFTETSTSPIDPRPACGSAAYSNVDPVPNGDSFFDATTYKGAFGSVNWLDGWSFFNLRNRPGFVRTSFTCPTVPGASAQSNTVYRLTWVGDYQTGAWDTDAAENIAFDPVRARAFIASAESGTVQVVSVANPTDMTGARAPLTGTDSHASARTRLCAERTRSCAEHTRTREPRTLTLNPDTPTRSVSRVSQRLAR